MGRAERCSISWEVAFGSNCADITVEVARTDCPLDSCSDSLVVCTLADNTAGTYEVVLIVEGVGRALTQDPFCCCFTYLLTLESVSPMYGGFSGGYLINITGEGFLPFVNVPNDLFGSGEIAYLPWFRFGIGLPFIADTHDTGLCPLIEKHFKYQLRNISSCFPRVFRKVLKTRRALSALTRRSAGRWIYTGRI